MDNPSGAKRPFNAGGVENSKLFFLAADGETGRAIAAVVRRRDAAIVVDVSVDATVAARRRRPIVAAVTDIAEAAIVAVARARSRVIKVRSIIRECHTIS